MDSRGIHGARSANSQVENRPAIVNNIEAMKMTAAIWLAAASLACAQDDVEASLNRRIPFVEFTGANIEQVADFVFEFCGANVLVTSKAKAAQATITLKLRNVTVKTFLNAVCESADLDWKTGDNIITIRSRDEMLADTVVDIYDVRSLEMKIRDFPGYNSDINSPTMFTPPTETDTPTPDIDIADLVKLCTGANNWTGPYCSITLMKGLLIVRHIKPMHAKIRAVIEKLQVLK